MKLKLDIVQLAGRDGDTHDHLQRAIYDYRRNQRLHVVGERIVHADGRRDLLIRESECERERAPGRPRTRSRRHAGSGTSIASSAELTDLPCASSASERVTPPPSASRSTKLNAPSAGNS